MKILTFILIGLIVLSLFAGILAYSSLNNCELPDSEKPLTTYTGHLINGDVRTTYYYPSGKIYDCVNDCCEGLE